MIKGCEAFLNVKIKIYSNEYVKYLFKDWKEETAQILSTRKGTFEVEDQVCLQKTKVSFQKNKTN